MGTLIERHFEKLKSCTYLLSYDTYVHAYLSRLLSFNKSSTFYVFIFTIFVNFRTPTIQNVLPTFYCTTPSSLLHFLENSYDVE